MPLSSPAYIQRQLVAGATDFILSYEKNEKPTLDRMIDIVLADKDIGSDELEKLADAVSDIVGWLERCVDELNARTRVRRSEDEALVERSTLDD